MLCQATLRRSQMEVVGQIQFYLAHSTGLSSFNVDQETFIWPLLLCSVRKTLRVAVFICEASCDFGRRFRTVFKTGTGNAFLVLRSCVYMQKALERSGVHSNWSAFIHS